MLIHFLREKKSRGCIETRGASYSLSDLPVEKVIEVLFCCLPMERF